ncbi:uncharacterized protein ACIBXB_016716 [Morphnus guianensis]
MANKETSNPGSFEKAGAGKPYLNKNYDNNFRRKNNWWNDENTEEEPQRLADKARRRGEEIPCCGKLPKQSPRRRHCHAHHYLPTDLSVQLHHLSSKVNLQLKSCPPYILDDAPNTMCT